MGLLRFLRDCDGDKMTYPFVYETALKLLCWSYMSYEYDPDGKGKGLYPLEHMMSLYGLNNFTMLHEKEKDTKVLLGWSKTTVVIVFRGTASATNAFEDLRVGGRGQPVCKGLGCTLFWWRLVVVPLQGFIDILVAVAG